MDETTLALDDCQASCHTSGYSAFNRIDAVMTAESQGFLPSSESLIDDDEGTGPGLTLKCKYSPNPRARVLSPFSMKWTLILSTAALLASAVIAAIDDDPPRLVVWAGTVQFIVTVMVAAIQAWRSSLTRQGNGKAKSAAGPETVATNSAQRESRIRG